MAFDPTTISTDLAVLETQVKYLSQMADERHKVLLQRLDERDEAFLEALERINESLKPLKQSVADLERTKSQVLAVAGAGSVLLSALVWLADRVWP